MAGQYMISGLTARLNVRSEPGGAVVSTLGNGDVVILTGQWQWGTTLNGVEYLWREMASGYWIAMVDALALTVVEAPPVDEEAILREALLDLRDKVNMAFADMLDLLE